MIIICCNTLAIRCKATSKRTKQRCRQPVEVKPFACIMAENILNREQKMAGSAALKRDWSMVRKGGCYAGSEARSLGR